MAAARAPLRRSRRGKHAHLYDYFKRFHPDWLQRWASHRELVSGWLGRATLVDAIVQTYSSSESTLSLPSEEEIRAHALPGEEAEELSPANSAGRRTEPDEYEDVEPMSENEHANWLHFIYDDVSVCPPPKKKLKAEQQQRKNPVEAKDGDVDSSDDLPAEEDRKSARVDYVAKFWGMPAEYWGQDGPPERGKQMTSIDEFE